MLASRAVSLHVRILLGLLFGAAIGVVVNVLTAGGPGTERFVSFVTEPIGRVWLNALVMVVIPLIISTLALGVAGIGSLRRLGKIGALTMVSFLCLTTLASGLGLAAVNLVRPGDGLSAGTTERLMEAYKGESQGATGLAQGALSVDLLVRIVPRNPVQAAANGEMLSVIFFALMLGVGLTMLTKERAEPMLKVLESLGHAIVAIISLVMVAAPIGVFCLIFSVTARFGFAILGSLVRYVMTVVGGLMLFQFVVYPIVLRYVAGRSPREFFRAARLVMLTAFSTSSSNATLPTTLQACRVGLGISPEITGFVVPLGATMNMNGTALFEGVTVLFLAQVFGVHLSLGTQVIVMALSVVAAIGTAGIPGGAIPLLMAVLGVVGVPAEGIAVVLGVDRILDMCRTVLNVTGDMVTAAIVERFEGGRVSGVVVSTG
jgi:dicarboxylate/amino acid:cation (Na+ or H+) symporter, DAACS family